MGTEKLSSIRGEWIHWKLESLMDSKSHLLLLKNFPSFQTFLKKLRYRENPGLIFNLILLLISYM